MHVMVTIGGSAVGEQDHDLMNRFRVLGEVVLGVNIFQTLIEEGRLTKKTPTQNISASFK
jgi:hypothetical protein